MENERYSLCHVVRQRFIIVAPLRHMTGMSLKQEGADSPNTCNSLRCVCASVNLIFPKVVMTVTIVNDEGVVVEARAFPKMMFSVRQAAVKLPLRNPRSQMLLRVKKKDTHGPQPMHVWPYTARGEEWAMRHLDSNVGVMELHKRSR